MHHEGNTGRLAPLDDADAILPSRRERLLHDRRKLARRRHSDELGVRFHRGGDVDEIELLTVEHFGGVGIGCACAVALCSGAGFSEVEIADGGQDDVVHAGPGRQMVFGKETAADDADPERRRDQAILLSAISGFRRIRAARPALRGR
jgi:hypothetical protein